MAQSNHESNLQLHVVKYSINQNVNYARCKVQFAHDDIFDFNISIKLLLLDIS